MASELFLVSLLVLLLVVVVLLVNCWMLINNKNRNLSELQISAGQPPYVLTVRIPPDRVQQLLDHLLDRVILHPAQAGAETAEGVGEEPVRMEDLEGQYGLKISTAASLRSKAMDTIQKKLQKWFSLTPPPAATSPPPGPSTHQDQHDEEPQQTSQGSHCTVSWEDEGHDESLKDK